MNKCNDCEKGVIGRGNFCKTCDGIGWLDVNPDQRANTVNGSFTGDEYVVNQDDIEQRIAIYAARARRIKKLALDEKISVDYSTTIFYPNDPFAIPPNASGKTMTIESLSMIGRIGSAQTEFDDDDFSEDDEIGEVTDGFTGRTV